jgi:hypothetical protein
MVGAQRRRAAGTEPRWCTAVCVVLALAAAAVEPVQAQDVATRLTGTKVLEDLHKAGQAINARAEATHDGDLREVGGRLAQMESALGKELGGDADQPLAIVDAQSRADATRANAAAQRAQAWLDAAPGCDAAETRAMTAALALMVDRLAADTASQKDPLPVINGIESVEDHRPLFVLQPGEQAPKFVLAGENLVDPQCANPSVSALDARGRPVAAQPKVIAAQGGQVELVWPGADKLAPGGYVLQLAAKRKAFLFGCVAEPAANAALQVASPLRSTVSYTLSATCPGGTEVQLDKASLPAISARNQTVTHAVAGSACANPVSYTVAATVATSDGKAIPAGPVTQPADASVTLGLKGGLTLSWDPTVRQVVVRSGALACKGVY